MSDVNHARNDDTLVTCFFDAPPSAAGESAEALAPSPQRGLIPASIVIRANGRRIALLCGERFVVGRHRSCDIVSPPAPAGDAAARRRSLKVSRRHCEIFRRSGAWCMRDGEGDRHSSFGTWWNGEQVFGEVQLGSRPGILSLGGPSAVDSVAFDVKAAGPSLVLSSRSAAADCHLLMAGETDLALVDERLAGLWVVCADGAMRWRRGSETGVFVPGTPIPGAGEGMWVE